MYKYRFLKVLAKSENLFRRTLSQNFKTLQKLGLSYDSCALEILPFCNSSQVLGAWQNINPRLIKLRDEHCFSVITCYFEKYSGKIEESKIISNETETEGSQVQIAFGEYHVEHVIESINYDLQSLISEVGGNLGLTLGLSGMSLIEYLSRYFKFLG